MYEAFPSLIYDRAALHMYTFYGAGNSIILSAIPAFHETTSCACTYIHRLSEIIPVVKINQLNLLLTSPLYAANLLLSAPSHVANDNLVPLITRKAAAACFETGRQVHLLKMQPNWTDHFKECSYCGRRLANRAFF